MYKVELTEKEVRGIGADRHAKTAWKGTLITFILGLVAVCIGAYYWEFMLGKVWMILAGMIWVACAFYQSRRSGKAGLKFLEEIKNGKGNG